MPNDYTVGICRQHSVCNTLCLPSRKTRAECNFYRKHKAIVTVVECHLFGVPFNEILAKPSS